MTREEYKKEIFGEPSSTKVYKSAKKYIKSLEAQLKAKDEQIEKFKAEKNILCKTLKCLQTANAYWAIHNKG